MTQQPQQEQQPFQIGAISAATMFEILEVLEKGAVDSHRRRLAESARAEMSPVGQRIVDEREATRQAAYETGFEAGAAEQRRISLVQAESRKIDDAKGVLTGDSFLNPNNPASGPLIDVSKRAEQPSEQPSPNRAARRANGKGRGASA